MSKREFLSQEEYGRGNKKLKTLSQNYEQNTFSNTSKDDLGRLKELLPNLVKPQVEGASSEEQNIQPSQNIAPENLAATDENDPASQPDFIAPPSLSSESSSESGVNDSAGDFIPPPLSSSSKSDDDSVGDVIPPPSTRVIGSDVIENTNVQRR